MPDYLLFKPFNPHGEVRIYRRDLPHWRQPGYTYFVTTRLADSIPRKVILEWKDMKQRWFRSHGLSEGMSPEEWSKQYRAIPLKERQSFERNLARQQLLELDKCNGACILKNPIFAQIVSKAYLFFDGHRLQCGDFVIMPNHIHWLVTPLPGYELEEIMASIDRYTARQINEVRGGCGAVWKSEPYDHIVRDRSELMRIRKYIADNPSHAGLKEDDYVYHRAGWLDAE